MLSNTLCVILFTCRFHKTFTRGIECLRADIETVKTALEKTGNPIVFSHNDLLLTNIILQRDANAGGQPSNVAFIDYEYAMLNHQAFDIANHFIEFAGVYMTHNTVKEYRTPPI